MVYFCPKDGTELVPSRLFPHPSYLACPKCGCVIGLWDPKNPFDMGELLEPWKDFDPHPTMRSGMIRTALEKHGTGRKANDSFKKPVKRQRPSQTMKLPLPPMGKRIVIQS